MTASTRGRTVVVTGAATGIGRAAAAGFAERGATVILVDVDEERGAAAAAALPGATFIRCDLSSEGQVAGMARAVADRVDRLDALVNNAGGFGAAQGIGEITLEEWERIIAVNLTSVFLATRALLPLLRRSDAARVVNLGSLAGQTAGWRTSPAYVAAKGGVHALTRALAAELAPERITVNTLAPSAVLTERIERLRDPDQLAATAAAVPLGRYQTPEELAEWIVFLASPESGFMTGQVVSVNGGRFMA